MLSSPTCGPDVEPEVPTPNGVVPAAQQWRLGGGPDDTNHTRVVDIGWPPETEIPQEAMLSEYAASSEPVGALSVQDFPRLGMLLPQASE